MKNVLIKVNGALPHQEKEVKNVYVYVDGIQRDRYITRNVAKIIAILKMVKNGQKEELQE